MAGAAPRIRNQSILVTGGLGFIGSHLVDELAEENDVTVIDDRRHAAEYTPPESVEFIEGDIRDRQLLAKASDGLDLIFHEAAIVSVDESINDPLGSHGVNVGGTLAVLEQARQVDARVVFASSTAIYGEPTEIPIEESDPKSPESPYGAQKLAGDIYSRQYAELYGLETISLRYFNVYGPRQRPGPYGGVISIFVDQALSNQPITVHGDGSQTRDFVYVDDVVRANLMAATTDRTGESYNVGTGTETSILAIAEGVRKLTDSDSEIVHVDAREGDIRRSRADGSRAMHELGFSTTVQLEPGLRDLIDWVKTRENGDGEA